MEQPLSFKLHFPHPLTLNLKLGLPVLLFIDLEMDYVPETYHLWSELHTFTYNNWVKDALFQFFSVFNNMMVNRYPYFHDEELGVLGQVGQLDYSLLSAPEYAPLLQGLLGLVDVHTLLLLDLLTSDPRMRALLRAAFQVVHDGQDPDSLPCLNSIIPRSQLFLDEHNRASSLLFHLEHPVVEALVLFYQLDSPYHNDMPEGMSIDFTLLQELQSNLAFEDSLDNPDFSYTHPSFPGPPLPEYAYHPDWDWGMDEDPDIHLLSCSVANMSSRFRGQ